MFAHSRAPRLAAALATILLIVLTGAGSAQATASWSTPVSGFAQTVRTSPTGQTLLFSGNSLSTIDASGTQSAAVTIPMAAGVSFAASSDASFLPNGDAIIGVTAANIQQGGSLVYRFADGHFGAPVQVSAARRFGGNGRWPGHLCCSRRRGSCRGRWHWGKRGPDGAVVRNRRRRNDHPIQLAGVHIHRESSLGGTNRVVRG